MTARMTGRQTATTNNTEAPLPADKESLELLPPHARAVDAIVQSLHTSGTKGLTQEESEQRREQFGLNTIQSAESTRWYQVLARQFTDVLILILVVAAIVSLLVGEWTDALTILAIVILNGVLGFVQEWKAERALDALRNMLAPTCRVVRNGIEQEADAASLVPGDLVQLETGDHVPADLRLIRCMNLQIDESALTGESVSVSKNVEPVDQDCELAQRQSMGWMGTAVTNGRAMGIVVATGGNTEFGRIAKLTETIDRDVTPLQRKLGVLGRQLGVAAIGISLLVAATGWLMGKPLLEMFLTAISLAVAVVPEGLPAVVTLTLALGVREMVRRKALLRRLRAAEGLGAANVICTDKTGTLTQNQMTVRHIWLANGAVDVTGVGYDPAGHFEIDQQRIDYRDRSDLQAILKSGLYCNHASLLKEADGWHERGLPTESALVVAAYKAWLDPKDRPEPEREFPFSSTRKRMTTVSQSGDGMMAHCKGAPEVLLPRCSDLLDGEVVRPFTDDDRQRVTDAMTAMAEQGLRTLAIARRTIAEGEFVDEDKIESRLTLLGVVGMLDPPRPEVPDAIRLAHSAGIKIFMITGDSAATATAIAKRIGLPVDQAVVGSELDQLDESQLEQLLDRDIVFARTTPEHKLRIVNRLQAQGHIVGMTGDGVNDAPALKKADIGIAMGMRGTDVAKGAADIVLTDDHFSSIIGAVEEGRRQYDNIQKFVRYLLSSNTGEVVAIFLNILLGGPLIFLPVQILWMNLVTDGLTAVALGLEPAEKDVMNRPPRPTDEPVLTKSGMAMIAILGTYVGVATLWLFHHYLQSGDPRRIAVAQTVAFTGIIMIEKINVLNFRSLSSPLFKVGFWSNPWVLLAIFTTISLQVAAVYVPVLQSVLHTVPLSLEDWGLMLLVAAPIFIVVEIAKGIRTARRSTDPS